MSQARPGEVLEQQVSLVKWWRSAIGVGFAERFLSSVRSTIHHRNLFPEDWDGAYLSDYASYALDRAETFILTSEMGRVVRHVAKSMPPQGLLETDLPTRAGFLWLEDPVAFVDINGKVVEVRAVTWSPALFRPPDVVFPTQLEGIALAFYSDTTSRVDEVMKAMTPEERKAYGHRLMLLHQIPWAFGYSYADEHMEGELDPTIKAPLDVIDTSINLRQWAAAFWRLTQQKVSVTTEHRADRPALRRIERIGGLLTTGDKVKVITLRKKVRHREADPDAPVTHVEWTHQWWVDEYWAIRHTKDGPRQTLVSPHVKGPDHLPLVVKDRVFRVSR